MPGKVCKGDICVDANYITTTWTVDQVQQVLTLSAVYSPYKIARIVHKRTFDTYQIVYHYGYFKDLITFLTTPRSKVVCGNTEIPASFISTVWDCYELSTAVSLLLQGYSYTYVARKVRKRTADVKAIRDHLDYFEDLLDQLYGNIEAYPGVIKHTYQGIEFDAPFEVPGEWTTEGLCKCEQNDQCFNYVMKYHKTNWLIALYYYESRDGKQVSYDIYRGIVRWYGVARLIGDIANYLNENVKAGYEQTDKDITLDVCDIDTVFGLLPVT